MTILERELEKFKAFISQEDDFTEVDWEYTKSCFTTGWVILGSIVLEKPEQIGLILLEIRKIMKEGNIRNENRSK